DCSEMVRQAECDQERVGNRAGAEDCRHHDVAHEAGHAREEREAADGEDAVDHVMASSSAKAENPLITALTCGTVIPSAENRSLRVARPARGMTSPTASRHAPPRWFDPGSARPDRRAPAG